MPNIHANNRNADGQGEGRANPKFLPDPVRSRTINLSRAVDFDKPLPLWYWILTVSVVSTLIRAVTDELNRNIPLSRTSRFIRASLGRFRAILMIVGMALNIWKAYR